VQLQAPDALTVPAVSAGDLFGAIRSFEALAQADVLRWGPVVAAASILAGISLALVGGIAGWRGLRRTGLAVGLTGAVGYALAVIVLRTLLRIR